MKPLNSIHFKCSGVYKFTKSQEKINPFMYIDDIKVFANSEKERENVIQTM